MEEPEMNGNKKRRQPQQARNSKPRLNKERKGKGLRHQSRRVPTRAFLDQNPDRRTP